MENQMNSDNCPYIELGVSFKYNRVPSTIVTTNYTDVVQQVHCLKEQAFTHLIVIDNVLGNVFSKRQFQTLSKNTRYRCFKVKKEDITQDILDKIIENHTVIDYMFVKDDGEISISFKKNYLDFFTIQSTSLEIIYFHNFDVQESSICYFDA